jgi:hypothetical protein
VRLARRSPNNGVGLNKFRLERAGLAFSLSRQKRPSSCCSQKTPSSLHLTAVIDQASNLLGYTKLVSSGMDDQVSVLLEYLATRKCHRSSLALNNTGDDPTTTTTTSSRAYRECLLNVLKNAGHGKELGDIRMEEDADACPLGWLQRVLETLFVDSYEACRNEQPNHTKSAAIGGAYLDDRHVLVAVQALGFQCTSQDDVGGTKPRVVSLTDLRLWRALLGNHVARRRVVAHVPQGRFSNLPWRRICRGHVRVSAAAVALLQQIVSSLLDPSNVKVWPGDDGAQISFRSSCGTFKANYFHFYDDNEHDNNNHDHHHTDMLEHDEDSGAWIGAVIDCPATPTKDSALENDGDSSLGSDPCGDDDEESISDDDENEDGADFSKRGSDNEMSTASMSSSLSATSSDESSEATGPATPLLLGRKTRRRERCGGKYDDHGPTKEEPATRSIRLSLQSVLLASVLGLPQGASA